jgi:hypothetical protein
MKKISGSWILVLVIGLSLALVSIILAQQPDQQQGGNQMRPGGPQNRQFDPEAMLKQRVDRTMEQLKLPEQEAAVIKPMIEKMMRTRMEQSQKTRDLMNSLREAVNAKDSGKVKSSLAAIKAKRGEDRTQIEKMEKELTEIISTEQEAALTLAGVLNSDGMGMGMGFGGPGGPGGNRGQGNQPGGGQRQNN